MKMGKLVRSAMMVGVVSLSATMMSSAAMARCLPKEMKNISGGMKQCPDGTQYKMVDGDLQIVPGTEPQADSKSSCGEESSTGGSCERNSNGSKSGNVSHGTDGEKAKSAGSLQDE